MIDHVTSSLCHQDPARVISIGATILPFCARCTGVYVSFFLSWIGLVALPYVTPWTGSRIFNVIAGAVLLTAGLILAAIEAAGSLFWSLPAVAYAGALVGIGLAFILRPVHDQVLGKVQERSVSAAAGLAVGCVTLLLLGLLVRSETAVAALFLVLASFGGVLLLYLFVNLSLAALILGWSRHHGTPMKTVNLVMLTALLILAEALIISSIRTTVPL